MKNGMKTLKILLVFTCIAITSLVQAEGLVLTSSDITGQLSNKEVFSGFGCHGENVSPTLNWENAPQGTKSFAITMYDPDAPTGSGWWHWLIFDIPRNVYSLQSNAGKTDYSLAPKASIQSMTSFGQSGFGGACPPTGDRPHQYIFTVYALKVEKLGVKSDATPSLVGFLLNQNLLAKASIIAYYSR
jgi:Raf kinase inhibitor-like YbhB/YbcL family protein